MTTSGGRLVDLTEMVDPASDEEEDKKWVFLVFEQSEPWQGSAFSYIRQLRWGPSFINRVCIGVYNDEELAITAAKEYWESEYGFNEGEDEDDFDPYKGFFWDGRFGSGCADLSKRVLVQKQPLNPDYPGRHVGDDRILQQNGRSL
mmetsp:Transcript_33118/g.47017  ORF Transcript_33118/g.47017 Transcript_33118/m.47017 type:complete len:146 (-) Transcript_33118:81-518(-)